MRTRFEYLTDKLMDIWSVDKSPTRMAALLTDLYDAMTSNAPHKDTLIEKELRQEGRELKKVATRLRKLKCSKPEDRRPT